MKTTIKTCTHKISTPVISLLTAVLLAILFAALANEIDTGLNYEMLTRQTVNAHFAWPV